VGVIFVVAIVAIVWALVGGGIGAAIGSSKGRAVAGFWLGLGLGFIGWIIVGVMEPSSEVRRNAMLSWQLLCAQHRNLASAPVHGAPNR
jgi:hypothetical protein